VGRIVNGYDCGFDFGFFDLDFGLLKKLLKVLKRLDLPVEKSVERLLKVIMDDLPRLEGVDFEVSVQKDYPMPGTKK